MAKYFRTIFGVVRKRALPFIAGLVFALLCFVVLNAAMEPVSASHYCGSNCHEMHRSLHTWQESVHGGGSKGLQAECIDCHLPDKNDYFRHIIVKAYSGGKDMYKHYMGRWFGTKYEPEKIRIEVLDRMTNEKCTRCHVDLLSKPSNEMIRDAHMEALKTDEKESQLKCVECHEDAGHQRE
ncbi:MAG: NapC/NirT family cytochrome c [Planctomycetota bacterium]